MNISRPLIYLVDDHPIVRQTILDWLRVEFSVGSCRGYTSAEELFEVLPVNAPDLVIMDVSLPGMNGIDAARQIKAMHPLIPILILTIHENPQYARDAIASGADGFLRKDRVYSDLIPAIRRMLAPGLPAARL